MTLWWRWFTITTTGELLGFTVPALAGALTTAHHLDGRPQALILAAAGAVEGALLGWSQAVVLRRVITGLDTGPWVRATASGAVLAYAMGMLPSLLFPLPVPAMVAVGAVAGTVLLASIGTAQWLVLRRYRPHSAWWIATTAGAWILGLAAFLAIATPLWHPGQSTALVILVGVLAGLAMAATVAAVTGWAALRLAAAPRRQQVADTGRIVRRAA
jgi:hypothetical protein